MLYHRGKPLLIQNKIGYMSPRLATLEQTAQFIPNLENESVFMKIQDDNTYLFAAMLPKEALKKASILNSIAEHSYSFNTEKSNNDILDDDDENYESEHDEPTTPKVKSNQKPNFL